MKIFVKKGSLALTKSGAVVLGLFENEKLSGDALELDRKVRGQISGVIRDREFTGAKNQICILRFESAPFRRVAVVGLGKKTSFGLDQARQAMGTAALALRNIGVRHFAAGIFRCAKVSIENIVQSMVEGAELGLYRYEKYKTEKDKPEDRKDIESITFIVTGKESPQALKGAKAGHSIAAAVAFCRDLANAPGSEITPVRFSEIARKSARQYGFKCRVIDKLHLIRQGFGGIMSIGKGSDNPPTLTVLEYNKARHRPVVLIGKGVTFDSGGISLKPADKMEEMKYDMSGAAAVLGTFIASARLKLRVNLVGLIPAVENMPSGHALKPGDIVKSLSGKTIEVLSTDAEGRVILADALSYAKRFNPKAVIDLATLTGACIIALGHEAAGLLGNDDELIEQIKEAGSAAGEMVWQMPLWDEYSELLKSEIADITNIGGREAGVITGAAFLKKFVDYSWAHLDIAGTAWLDKAKPYIPKCGNAFGVRLLVEFLRQRQRRWQ